MWTTRGVLDVDTLVGEHNVRLVIHLIPNYEPLPGKDRNSTKVNTIIFKIVVISSVLSSCVTAFS